MSDTQAGPEEIAHAVRVLREGGLVAFPTETVYGLGADAFRAAAVNRIFELKGRPPSNPLIVHVSGAAMARTVTASWPREAQLLADAFWPGPLSIVLPKVAKLPSAVTAGGPTVAVRCPDHPLTLALLEIFGSPLVGPSANPSGFISPTSAEHVRDAFRGKDVFVLDGGPCRRGIESTVVSLTGGTPRVLRPGMITPGQISQVLGMQVAVGPDGQADGPAESPGMLASHYAPRTPAALVETGAIPARLAAASRAVVLTHSGTPAPPPHTRILMPREAESYAAALYGSLHEADAMGAEQIIVERPPDDDDPLWDAILDRLRRATNA